MKKNESLPLESPLPNSNLNSNVIQITLQPLTNSLDYNLNNKKTPNEESKETSNEISNKNNHETLIKRPRLNPTLNDRFEESNTLHTIWQLPQMMHTYDNIPTNLKATVVHALIQRSSHDTLKWMNSVITPILKHDVLSSFPLEIARWVIRYLDAFSLAQASLVCRRWKSIVDEDQVYWKKLLIQDGYHLQDPIQPDAPITHYKKLYARHHTLKQNWQKGRAVETAFRGHDKFVVTCLQFDSDKIVSGADDSHINIYSTTTGKKRMTLEGHEGGVWALQYTGYTLVTGSTDRRVRVWDMDTGKCTHIFSGHTSTVRCLLITHASDGPYIVTGSRDSTLRVWRLPDPKDEAGHFYGGDTNPYFVHALIGHRQSVRAIAADQHTLVSGSYDNTVRVWNIKTGRIVHVLEGHAQKVYSVVLDLKRNVCMSGSMDSTIRIWDLNTGECLKKLEGHTVLVGLLGLSHGSLVSAAADSVLRVWSPETGVCHHALSGHGNSITCFQHDNTKIVSGSEGGLKMWDIKTGRFIRDLITDVDGVWRVAFDGRRCVAAIQKKNETSFKILDFGVYNM